MKTTYVTDKPRVSLGFIKNAKAELVDSIPCKATIIAVARKGFGWPQGVLAKKDGKLYKAIQKDNGHYYELFNG